MTVTLVGDMDDDRREDVKTGCEVLTGVQVELNVAWLLGTEMKQHGTFRI